MIMIQGALVLDMGRFLTGCGIGVFSFVVIAIEESTHFFLLSELNSDSVDQMD